MIEKEVRMQNKKAKNILDVTFRKLDEVIAAAQQRKAVVKNLPEDKRVAKKHMAKTAVIEK